MFNLDRYLDLAERPYLLDGQDRFVFEVRYSKEIDQNLQKFLSQINAIGGLEVSKYADRRIERVWVGTPREISFGKELLIKMRPDLRGVRSDFERALAAGVRTNVREFLEKNLTEAKRKSSVLVRAVRIAEYLIGHPELAEGLYPRLIRHGQGTKTLLGETLTRNLLAFHFRKEKGVDFDICGHFKLKKKPAVFQYFADSIVFDCCELKNIHGLITSDNVARFSFSGLSRILIVENEETFLALHGRLPKSLILFGSGDRSASLAFLAPFVHETQVLYWGDMDAAGYEALNSLALEINGIKAVCMGMECILAHEYLAVPTNYAGSPKNLKLCGREYSYVQEQGILIEQEQLDLDVALEEILQTSAGGGLTPV